MKTEIELLMQSRVDGKLRQPPIEEGLTWTTERFGSPGQLDFKVVKDSKITVHVGDAVRLRANGHKIFFGFVFKKRRGSDGIVNVTAYDQLRYLKNKDTVVYEDKTAGQVVEMIARDFGLKTGSIADTGYRIPSRVEDNSTLFDAIGNALDLTLEHEGRLYVLYDDFGKIALKPLEEMKVGKKGKWLMLSAETCGDVDYQSSIDDDTYDQVKVVYDDRDGGAKEVYVAKSTASINKWGVLQKYETIQEGENGRAKADALLELYNTPTRSLQLKEVRGDWRVRGGSMVVLDMMASGERRVNWMLVERCRHEIRESEWLMTLDLRGGDINA